MRALYISQNGILENLGQSQVLPYVRGLARRGHEMDLLSFELAGADEDAIATLARALEGEGIRWTPLRRRRDPRLRIKLAESAKGVLAAIGRALRRRPAIVHGRSYLPTAVCDLVATVVPRARLVFDCRGMIGDEYVDAGYWTRDRIEYRLVKRYEARAFRRAEGVVVLTDALRRYLEDAQVLGPRTAITAIPCCVDLERFRFEPQARDDTRRALGLDERFVLVYSGSLGTWYREAEVARLAALVRARVHRMGRAFAFLLLTPAPPEELVGLLAREGVAEDEIVVRRVLPAAMPAHLAAGDVGVSFIMSCFSKKGSSPTKVAEYLACGLPVVLNGDIGDQADLAAEPSACVVIDGFDEAGLARAADRAVALGSQPLDARVREGRRVARARFGLEEVGIARYDALYTRLAATGR